MSVNCSLNFLVSYDIIDPFLAVCWDIMLNPNYWSFIKNFKHCLIERLWVKWLIHNLSPYFVLYNLQLTEIIHKFCGLILFPLKGLQCSTDHCEVMENEITPFEIEFHSYLFFVTKLSSLYFVRVTYAQY